jgi:hypothetical protein
VEASAVNACPHCGEPLGGHVCADRERWTNRERDEMRAIIRHLHPTVLFAPSSAQMADRFGERNRRDRE